MRTTPARQRRRHYDITLYTKAHDSRTSRVFHYLFYTHAAASCHAWRQRSQRQRAAIIDAYDYMFAVDAVAAISFFFDCRFLIFPMKRYDVLSMIDATMMIDDL